MIKRRLPVSVLCLFFLFLAFHLSSNHLSVTYGQIPTPRQIPTRPPLPIITVTPQPEATPLPVNPMVSAGNAHSLALDANGAVWSWGKNVYGQLGRNEDENEKPGKVIVEEEEEVIFASVAAGGNHSLALSSSGDVWAWGKNDNGQLGDNSTSESDIPLKIDPFYFMSADGNDNATAKAIAAGKNHSLALLSDGSVYSWGNNENGQLGQDFLTESLIPLKVEELSDIVAIAAGDDHSLALSEKGEVYAWGSNQKGQLGDNSIPNISHTPVTVKGLKEIQSIAAGGTFNLALDTDGSVWAWGNNELGQSGNSSGGILKEPAQVDGLLNVNKIAAGESHSLVIQSETIYAWGNGEEGQLGLGLKLTTSIPQKLTRPREAIGIAGGKSHSLALDAKGEVWAWGDNKNGQLGIQDEKNNLKPSRIKTDVDGNEFRLFEK